MAKATTQRKAAKAAAVAAKKPQPKFAPPQPPPKKKVVLEKGEQHCMSWRQRLFKNVTGSGKKTKQNVDTPAEEQHEMVPYTLHHARNGSGNGKDAKPDYFWPSAIFFNATYPNGILVPAADNKTTKKPAYFAPTQGYDKSKEGYRHLPSLTSVESKLWCHKHAGHTSVARRFPVEVGRLLGTITLEIKDLSKKGKKASPENNTELPSAFTKPSKGPLDMRFHKTRGVKRITPKLAAEEAKIEALQTAAAASDNNPDQALRAAEIVQQWRAIEASEQYDEPWNPNDGSLPLGRHDKQCVDLIRLKKWLLHGLNAGTLEDINQHAVRELYGGLTVVPINAEDILVALVNLVDPRTAVYGVPLLAVYPRMIPTWEQPQQQQKKGKGKNKSKAKSKNSNPVLVWKIKVGIYMHRLMPEIFTCQAMHIVMSALDENSYRVSQPIRLPPTGPAVFQSNPFPKVDTSLLEGFHHDDDEKGGLKQKSKNKSSSRSQKTVINVDSSYSDSDSESEVLDVQGGSRDEMILSPFSVKGLLKLLENKGCDVSSWPKIERELQGFRLDLLLHQKHAICWMLQMEFSKMVSKDEDEPVYGINSILWEQRTFPDGGHFYYSPALGQVRLGAPPPHMKGGLLCDEQGLGKTVEVLGLIMATQNELKQEVKKYEESKKKASYKYEGESYYSAESEGSDDETYEYLTHTTLIIVPPALVAQWLHEIEKAVGQTTLTVSLLLDKTGEMKQCLPPPPPPGREDDNDKKEDDVDDWEKVQASDIVLTTYDALSKTSCTRVLHAVQWGRVVIDEMQEIRSSTTKIAKACEALQCYRRWCISGTPIFSGIEDLKGELNFLRLDPFSASLEDGFFKFSILDPWEAKDPHAVAMLRILGLVTLRRSKDMTIAETGSGLLDLKPLTVEFIPVAQSHSERALYCFLESIVAAELQAAEDAKNNKHEYRHRWQMKKANMQSREQCLRLLRETCITPMLLNGGIGMPSQLRAIDKIMTRKNSREHAEDVRNEDVKDARKKRAVSNIKSCDQALRFLTQFQQTARVDEDFVTDERRGGGRGIAARDRAVESADARYEEAKASVEEAKKTLSMQTKKRAVAHWHYALEMVTTGQYTDGRSHKFSGLWKWRAAVQAAEAKRKSKARRGKKKASPPQFLLRGWRPSEAFVQEDLYEKRPGFSWAHPFALLFENIPPEVTQKELATAVRESLKLVPPARLERERLATKLEAHREARKQGKSSAYAKIEECESTIKEIDDKMKDLKAHDSRLKLPTVVKVKERKHLKGFWRAVIHMDDEKTFTQIMSVFGRSLGAAVECRRKIPHMQALEKVYEEKVSQAESLLQVYPSPANRKSLADTRKAMEDVGRGLRMVSPSTTASRIVIDDEIKDEVGTDQAYIIVTKALGATRSPKTHMTASALIDSAESTLSAANELIPQQKYIISRGENKMKMLHKAVKSQVSEEIQQLSAYNTLEALSDGLFEKTMCPICLCYLGSEGGDDDEYMKSAQAASKDSTKATITMINCGHFYCTKCITSFVHDRLSSYYQQVNCPSCRQEFSLTTDTILVDPNLKDEREALEREKKAAKELVREAGRLLEESHGHLEAELWRALYLAFDLPTNVSNSGYESFPAIPRDFLTHLRAATGMPTNCTRGTRPPAGSAKDAGRCSKIQKLLEDLPLDERSVVFSSNKDVLMHLMMILEMDKIGCQAIYTGQSTSDLSNAVTKWESSGKSPSDPPPFPCLLVQAGAAAAGLTLTAACKMFILEPFLRQEEEQQAYARLHRFSQEKKVSVKVYYTPVSVESRLLEWRKGGKTTGASSAANSLVAKDTEIIIHEIDSDDEEEDMDEEETAKKEREDAEQAKYLLGLLD